MGATTYQPALKMNKCPKCGHEWPDSKRASGGKARWRGMSKAQRKRAASDAAKVRWAKAHNEKLSDRRREGASPAERTQ